MVWFGLVSVPTEMTTGGILSKWCFTTSADSVEIVLQSQNLKINTNPVACRGSPRPAGASLSQCDARGPPSWKPCPAVACLWHCLQPELVRCFLKTSAGSSCSSHSLWALRPCQLQVDGAAHERNTWESAIHLPQAVANVTAHSTPGAAPRASSLLIT